MDTSLMYNQCNDFIGIFNSIVIFDEFIPMNSFKTADCGYSVLCIIYVILMCQCTINRSVKPMYWCRMYLICNPTYPNFSDPTVLHTLWGTQLSGYVIIWKITLFIIFPYIITLPDNWVRRKILVNWVTCNFIIHNNLTRQLTWMENIHIKYIWHRYIGFKSLLIVYWYIINTSIAHKIHPFLPSGSKFPIYDL